jgi:hypothetical protein
MKSFEVINEVEAGYRQGKPTLGKSYEMLLERWEGGARDRETALRLLFLAWYTYARAGDTGLSADVSPELFRDLATTLNLRTTADEEVCFVLHIMTQVAAWPFGGIAEERYWAERGEMCAAHFGDRLKRTSPGIFEDRGEYGYYFAHQARNR